jgi:formamidopyrimidine-DNA glycosylase
VPELPEVETVRRTLAPAIGRRVTGVWTSGKPLRMRSKVDRAGLDRASAGAVLADVRRHGKYLLLDFAGRDAAVMVHLGMSGRLRLVPRDEPRAAHTHVVFAMEGPHELRYSDPRRFGIVEVVPAGAAAHAHPALALLGPDALERVDPVALHAAARRSSQSLKAILLDQSVVAGVGNIYASEALWRARLKPTRRGTGLALADARVLAREIPRVFQDALRRGGTSLKDFVDADGREGENAEYLRVYDRAGEACPRRGCGGRIRRSVQQGRVTFHCPRCQPR